VEVRPGIFRCFFFSLLDIVNRLGGNDPLLGIDIINGELNSLSVMLGEEPQVFPSDFHVRPETFI
jgi:hypothetical protein